MAQDIEIAAAALHEGRLGDAEAACRRGLAAGTNIPASVLLCRILLLQGRIVDAETVIDMALVHASTSPDLLNLRGVVLNRLGRKAEAVTCFDNAIERRLNSPAAQENLNTVLAELRDPSPRFTVTVVTPTVGTPFLAQAIESVQAQTYPLLEHLVVTDGPDFRAQVRGRLPRQPRYPIRLLELPQNTGAGGFNGHRIYGAAPYLVNGRFVAFLDEDNWYEPDHIASLMSKITAAGLEWAYSLRRIVTTGGDFIAYDDCESLGKWPTWNDPNSHLVDANCYLIRRDIAIATGAVWHRALRDEQSPDFVLCRQLLNIYTRYETNGRYTVNYRIRATTGVRPEFFLNGNAAMHQRYGSSFPWRSAEGQ